jgi:hypothetical protein
MMAWTPGALAWDGASFAGVHAVEDGVLAESRGGVRADDILEKLQADLTGNTATGTYSGSNTISNGAFGGANGIFNTFQNFGNNVIYQSVINVNVTTVP